MVTNEKAKVFNILSMRGIGVIRGFCFTLSSWL